jgi:hypothetical protein
MSAASINSFSVSPKGLAWCGKQHAVIGYWTIVLDADWMTINHVFTALCLLIFLVAADIQRERKRTDMNRPFQLRYPAWSRVDCHWHSFLVWLRYINCWWLEMPYKVACMLAKLCSPDLECISSNQLPHALPLSALFQQTFIVPPNRPSLAFAL